MKRLLLVVGMVGCGPSEEESAAALEMLGATTARNWKSVTDVTGVYAPSVSDAGLVHLKGLTKLKTLGLERTKVTDAGVAELKQALPKCRIGK